MINKFNEDELNDFKKLAELYPIEVRFLEYMPFSGNRWEREKVISERKVLEILNSESNSDSDQKLQKLPPDTLNDVAKFYSTKNFKGRLGFISTVTSPFCSGCNRIRITADGYMKNCLFSENETDLKEILRDGGLVDEIELYEKLCEKISENVRLKKFSRNLDKIGDRPMVKIGG